MAFKEKIDFVGLANNVDNIQLRSNGDNASNQTLEIPKSDGSIIGCEVFGHIKAPTCGYAITGPVEDRLSIGRAYNDNFALQSVTITTGAGQEPTFEATAVQIEQNSDSSTYCQYITDELDVSPARHASHFGVLTGFTETSAMTLQSGTYTAEADISPATINGEPVASDSTGGRQTVQLTLWTNTDETAPSVTIANGWK